MSRCDRFKREGLERLERGLPLDEHFESCPDCLTARESYARLRGMLDNSTPLEKPREGWEAEVRSRIAQSEPGKRKWIWRLAPAAAVILVVVAFQMIPPTDEPQLTIEITRGDRPDRRGEDPHRGDQLTLDADTGAAPHAELRVYRDDTELILSCSDSPPCVLSGTRLSATLVLEQLGVFQPLLITSEQPIPPPGATLDEDAAAVLELGGSVVLSEEIRVR
jgi:hypothetical protein